MHVCMVCVCVCARACVCVCVVHVCGVVYIQAVAGDSDHLVCLLQSVPRQGEDIQGTAEVADHLAAHTPRAFGHVSRLLQLHQQV